MALFYHRALEVQNCDSPSARYATWCFADAYHAFGAQVFKTKRAFTFRLNKLSLQDIHVINIMDNYGGGGGYSADSAQDTSLPNNPSDQLFGGPINEDTTPESCIGHNHLRLL